MPWKGVTVSEERQRFLEDYRLMYSTVSGLAERFSISSRIAHKWIDRFEETLSGRLPGVVPAVE
jgi:transposase-like protein